MYVAPKTANMYKSILQKLKKNSRNEGEKRTCLISLLQGQLQLKSRMYNKTIVSLHISQFIFYQPMNAYLL